MNFITLELINGALVTLNTHHIIQLMPRDSEYCVVITPKEQLTAKISYEKLALELKAKLVS